MATEQQDRLALDEFLEAAATDVAWAAPATMIYAAAGTRRAAALAGIAADSEAYASWSRGQMIAACRLIFAHGVQHLFTILAAPGQFREVGRHRERLLEWIDWGTAGPEALDDFRALGWRVRLIGVDTIDRLAHAAARLRALPAADGEPTLWLWVIPDEDAPWRWQCQALQEPVPARSDAICALYGEPVPRASLFLGFGKPAVADYLLPPLLGETVHCYWTQRPGYSLTQDELRQILFDYACVRPTWRNDKSGRSEAALADRALWEREA
ncbi:MAG: hypothetical protein KDE24_38100, partial [Caldilinea sp.]|nr:hypothetical protein [Caldilinea sp.]